MNLGYIKYANVGVNYLLKRARLPAGRIIGLTIEPTNICNLDCIYCPQSDKEHHFINGKGYMAFETYRTILDGILSDFSPKFISLHRDGEPLLHKELERFIEYTVSKNIKVGISSNCTLLHPARIESLLDSGLSFIKTDFCADKEIYEKLRTGGNWETVYEGMINTLSAAKKRGSDFQLNITDISTHGVPEKTAAQNMAELEKLFSAYKDQTFFLRVHFHNALDESVEIMTDRTQQNPEGKYSLCHHPWVHIVVDFQGNVVPCCRDLRSEFICGNLLKDSMKDIWNNPRFVHLRKALAEKKPEKINICSKCDLPYSGSYAGVSPLLKIKNIFFSKIWKR